MKMEGRRRGRRLVPDLLMRARATFLLVEAALHSPSKHHSPSKQQDRRDGISTLYDTQRSGWCTTSNFEEIHRHRQFRTLAPISMCTAGLSLVFIYLAPQPITVVNTAESDWRFILAVSNAVAFVIYGYTMWIVDDKQAHCALVWLNELNVAFTCALFIWYGRVHGVAVWGLSQLGVAEESKASVWGLCQFCSLLWLVPLLMNLLGFPTASRGERSPRTHPMKADHAFAVNPRSRLRYCLSRSASTACVFADDAVLSKGFF